ncbi:MAG: lipase family protein [Caulobacteraceae bacterium]
MSTAYLPPLPSLTPADAKALPTWRAAYSDRTAAMMATFSWLAYLPFEPDGKATLVDGHRTKSRPEGPAALAAHLKGGGFDLVEIFDWDNVQAFLAKNTDQFAVLAFRGTANAQDWGINLNALTVPMEGFPGVRVHRGFWQAFSTQRDRIVQSVNKNVPDNIGLYITGHSLGGALAQIASAVLERNNLAACYTYGSPRVATSRFDLDVKCPNYRLVNHWDLVPGVPLPVIAGYFHAGDPRLLAQDPTVLFRRDHWLAAWLWAQLRAVIGWGVTHRLFNIADHMIWNYSRQLDEIAAERARPATERTRSRIVRQW